MARQGIEPSRGGDRSFLLGTGEHDGRDQDRRRSGARRNNSVRRGVILKTFAARPFSMFVTIVSWILRRALALASAAQPRQRRLVILLSIASTGPAACAQMQAC